MVDHQQKGTALITAMVVMSVLAALATFIIIQQDTTLYRSRLLFNVDRAYLYINGTVAWAESILKQRAQEADTVMIIADELPPTATPYQEGKVWANLTDLQGRFNLNNLYDIEHLNEKLEQLQRLFSIVLFDVSGKQISQIIQSIGNDIINQKDENQRFSHISQLRMLDGVTADIYQRISPYLTVLPEPTAINVNTAAQEILMSLSPQLSASDVDALIQAREQEPFATTDAFLEAMSDRKIELEKDTMTVESDYYLLSSVVAIDEQELRTYTVFHLTKSEDQSDISVLYQSIGTV